MSKITTLFNALISTMELTFKPSDQYRRLYNPYEPDQNPEMVLRKGWGVRVSGGENTQKQTCPQYSMLRTFEVILTRESPAKESDPGRRESAKLELLEDLHTLIAASVKDSTLSGVAYDFKYNSDGGFEDVFVEEKPYTVIVADFSIEYIEQIPGA